MGGYPTRVQYINRSKQGGQWYVNFPAELARTMGIERGEQMVWSIGSRQELTLRRVEASPEEGKKTAAGCSDTSSGSGRSVPKPSGRSASSSGRGGSR